MIVSVAFLAPMSPPDTGASSESTPLACISLAMARRAGWPDRRVVHVYQALMCTLDDSALAQCHSFHVWRIGQVGEYNIYLRRQFRGRGRRLCTFADKFIHGPAGSIVNDERETRLEDVPCHRLAHKSEADIANS